MIEVDRGWDWVGREEKLKLLVSLVSPTFSYIIKINRQTSKIETLKHAEPDASQWLQMQFD